MNSQKLHEYFTDNHSRGIIDHAIRANVDDKGRVSFYIHPHGHDGNTLDFWVLEDTFWPKDELTPEELIQVIKDTARVSEATPDGPLSDAIGSLCKTVYRLSRRAPTERVRDALDNVRELLRNASIDAEFAEQNASPVPPPCLSDNP